MYLLTDKINFFCLKIIFGKFEESLERFGKQIGMVFNSVSMSERNLCQFSPFSVTGRRDTDKLG